MISRARFINLQSHADTTLDFVPGINVIQSPSDVGKSAIFRGLQDVVQNQITKCNLRRHKTKKMTVDIDGVVKCRTASKNYYQVNGGPQLKALRTNVPTEVTDSLRLSDVNFQGQHSAYFLIMDSPGKVARTLNKVADLQIIDQSRKEIRAKGKEAKTEKKYLENELEIQEEKIKKLQWVTEASKEYEKIEELDSEVLRLKTDSQNLESIVQTCLTLRKEVESIPDMSEDLGSLKDAIKGVTYDDTLELAINKVLENQITIPDPVDDIQKMIALRIQLSDPYPRSLAKAVRVAADLRDEVSSYPEVIDDLSSTLLELNAATAAKDELEEAILTVVSARNSVDFATSEYETSTVKLEKKMKELGICPLCGGDL